MKRIYMALLPALLVAPLAGCNDLLQEKPKSFITTNNYFTTPDQVQSAALAMYANFYDWNYFKVQQWWTFELAADQGRFHPDEPNEETRSPEYLNWTVTSRDAVQPWAVHYWQIQRENVVLDALGKVSFPTPAQKAALEGEARFMRAYDYFWLARAYGGVPIYTSLEEQAAGKKARATEAQVIDLVIADAAFGAANLPAHRTGRELGRATSAAAYLLLADAYRWKANVLSHAQADWQKSADAAEAVIGMAGYGLNNNYLDAFRPGSQNRPEEIFAVQALKGGGWFATSAYGTAFFARNVPKVEGWAVVSPTPQFYNSYIPGDYRWNVTFWTQGCSNGQDPDYSSGSPVCPTGETLVKFTPNSDVATWPNGYPHVHKYRPTDYGQDLYGGDVNTQLYRYADALLLAAEAEFELGRPANALGYLNQIRARARKGTGSESRAQPADLTSVTKDVIYQERSWELSYEIGKRWFDLVQRGPTYFAAQLTANDPLSGFMNNVNANHMRLPIPLAEIQKNPNLQQNPGY